MIEEMTKYPKIEPLTEEEAVFLKKGILPPNKSFYVLFKGFKQGPCANLEQKLKVVSYHW